MNREEMTIDEAIAIIRKEYLCVDRDCDIERSCGKCDLMMPSKEPILEAYKMAIKALEQMPVTTTAGEGGVIYYPQVEGVTPTVISAGKQEPSGDAISRKIISAFLSGLISDETERKKALQYINELPSVNLMPCEDAISRQAVLDMAEDITDQFGNKHRVVTEGLISMLPSVNPQPKTGEWNTFELFQSGIKETWYECPKCKWSNALLIPRNYCPNCGAKMVEPQESEDKE